MFDALKRLFQPKAPVRAESPSLPWPPGEPLDAALAAAIRLFSRRLEQSGKSAGRLSLPGEAPQGVAAAIAGGVIPAADSGGRKFLTFAASADLKSFTYTPHLQLYRIYAAATLLETGAPRLPAELVASEAPPALLHAHLMRGWLRYVAPTGEALRVKDAREARLEVVARGLSAELSAIAGSAPRWLSAQVDIGEAVESWTHGYPAALSQYLSVDTPRINDLAMSQPAADLILHMLATAPAKLNARAVA
jgi:hypothetical protein